MRKLSILCLFLLVSQLISAQVMRVELESKKNSDNYNIIPVGENGLMVFFENDERDRDGNKLWGFTRYNTGFKEVWNKEIPIIKKFNYVDYYYNGEELLYLLFAYNQEYQIVSLAIKTGEIETKFSNKIGEYNLEDFLVFKNSAFFIGRTTPSFLQSCGQACFTYTLIPAFTGATIYKQNGVLQNTGLKTGKNSSLFINPKGHSNIIGAKVNSDAELNVLFRKVPESRTSVIERIKYSPDGNQLGSTTIKTSPDKEITSGRIGKVGKSTEMLIGTYSLVNPKKRKRLSPTFANGLYFCKIEDEKQEYIKHYDFSKFQGFYSQISGSFKTNRIKKQKGEGDVSYRLLVHDILIVENEYIVIAEAYYPEYRTETYYTTDPNGRMVMRTRQVFDGWRYTHAIIASFNNDGELLWDNAFEIGNIKSFVLKERVKILPSENEILMLYSWGGDVYSKVISEKTVIENKLTNKIETKNNDDKVKVSINSDVAYWYDNYFISFGYQTIKSDVEKKSGGKKKRTVFYFNKLQYGE